jgi:hypothetical protein
MVTLAQRRSLSDSSLSLLTFEDLHRPLISLSGACPLAAPDRPPQGVSCFMLLLEMVGWAWTWDPEQETPVAMLSDYIQVGAGQGKRRQGDRGPTAGGWSERDG